MARITFRDYCVILILVGALLIGIGTTCAPFALATEAQSSMGVGHEWQKSTYTCWGSTQSMFGLATMVNQYYRLPPRLVHAVIEVESGWNPDATNLASGAQGLMQIHPEHHPNYAGSYDPCQNMNYGAWYLTRLLGDNDPRYPEGLPYALNKYSGGAEGYPERVMDIRDRVRRAVG